MPCLQHQVLHAPTQLKQRAACPAAWAAAHQQPRRHVAVSATPPSGVCVEVEVQQAVLYNAAQQLEPSLQSTLLSLPLITQPARPQTEWTGEDFHSRFTLNGEILGQGTYGTVRVCTDVSTGKEYAVKILSKQKYNQDRTEIIAREVHLWRMLAARSPHIVGLHAAYEDANNIFIVQELMVGGDLQGLLEAQKVLSEGDAANAMRGILRSLAACHDADVCYGDVKPANFMLAQMWPSVAHIVDPSKPKGEMQLKAIDFGCAQYCPDGCQLMQSLSGTPVYMAPEVITDRCYSISMDVWAAGVILYQMLTGQFPFWDTNIDGLGRIHPRQILKDIQSGSVLWDIPAMQGLSQEAKDLLHQMLEKDPAMRISAQQALQHPWLQQ